LAWSVVPLPSDRCCGAGIGGVSRFCIIFYFIYYILNLKQSKGYLIVEALDYSVSSCIKTVATVGVPLVCVTYRAVHPKAIILLRHSYFTLWSLAHQILGIEHAAGATQDGVLAGVVGMVL